MFELKYIVKFNDNFFQFFLEKNRISFISKLSVFPEESLNLDSLSVAANFNRSKNSLISGVKTFELRYIKTEQSSVLILFDIFFQLNQQKNSKHKLSSIVERS